MYFWAIYRGSRRLEADRFMVQLHQVMLSNTRIHTQHWGIQETEETYVYTI